MKKAVLHRPTGWLFVVRQATAAILLLSFPFEQALQAADPTLPTGGAFVAGSGSVARSNGALTINQTSNRAVIDWSSFSIGAGGKVMFANGSGATLNRVNGNQMSIILGSLQASGTVYLINPQGVLVGPSGRIRTGGDFVAATLNLPAGSFMSGGALVFDGKSEAFVKNLGNISSTGGSIFLIANQVVNDGSLLAPNGSASMAAGGQVLLKDSNADQRIFVNVAGGDVTNSGKIAAAQVELKANGGNIYALAGNNGGEIRATGTTTRGGHVWLIADVGTTRVSSEISARNANGRGGFVETSGHTVEIGPSSIHTGKGGSWLVDPVDLTVDSTAASTIQSALNGGTNVTESTSASGSSGYGTTASGSGDINVASGISWNSSASLTLSAYRNINVQDGVTIASGGSGSLTLQADNAATGNGTVSFNGTGKVNFSGSGNVDLFYHPTTYSSPTNYGSNVTMGSGTFTPYMTVNTATDLQNVNNNLAGKYALNADIDASSIPNFSPIAHGANYADPAQGFSGLFDGKSHTISNLSVNDSSNVASGLFAQTSSTGIVRNLGLKNASVQNSVDNSSVGGLAGVNFGTISSSYVTGSVSGSGDGNPFVGGLVGENEGTVTNTYASASVTALTHTDCDSCTTIGGLVGANGFANSSASISSSLATGAVSKTGSAMATTGGFGGENDGSISSSYFDSQTTGQSTGIGFVNGTSNSATAQTTAQLQNGSLPSGFSSTYWIASAGSYPKLGWQAPVGIAVTGVVYNGLAPLGSVTVMGLANGVSFGSTTTNASGAFSLLAPAGTTGVLAYLTGGSKGNTFSNNLTSSFSGVDIYTNTLRLINVTTNNYSGILTALSSALGGNSGSNFLFSMSGGNLALGSGVNFVLAGSIATTIDQSIAATGSVQLQSAGDLTLNAATSISATGAGTPLTLSTGGKFTNNAGANALQVSGGGRWLLYSQNPANDTLGSLGYNFKQYNASYGSATAAQSTSNGLLYSVAPSLTASLIGTTSKTYDGTTNAAVSTSNLTDTGALAADIVTLNATGAAYSNKNAGTGKSVTATGISASVTDATGAIVYGYRLSSTSASGNIGTINAAQLTYTADIASRTYGSVNPTFTGTVSGFVGGDTLASATTGTAAFSSPATTTSSVGSYAINGSGLTASNGNYTFQQASGNATALTIDPAVLTYTANYVSRTYGSANPALTGTVTGFVNGDTQSSATTGSLSFSTAATATSNVGAYAINGSGLTTNSNYILQQAASNATALTINPATLTYTANTSNRTYGDANPAFTGTVTGFVNGDTKDSATAGSLSFNTSATAASNVGSYAIDGSGLTANNGNYTFQQASGNATALTIEPAVLTYTASSINRSYGSANPALTGTVSGFVNGDTQSAATTGTLSFSTAATAASNVGSYAIDGSGLTANNGNYTFQQASGNATALIIDPAVLTYTANSAARTYGDANPSFTGTVSGFVNGDTQGSATTGSLSFGTAATVASNVGSYAVSGSGLTANSNYTLQQAATNVTALTINPATLTYTADTSSRTYGDANPSFAGTVSGFVNGDTLVSATTGTTVFSSPANPASNVGSYAINGSGLTAKDGNYTFQQAAGNATALTIDPAVLTYTANSVNRTYGSANPALTGTVTGFVNGDTQSSATAGSLVFSTAATAASNVGSYAINGSSLTTNSNYTLQQAATNATALTIDPAILTYTANTSSRTYGDANPPLAGTVSGFVSGDTLASATTGTAVFSSPATAASNVGSYAINGSGLTANHGNYTFQQAGSNPTALTIDPAILTYTANSATRTYGSANPAFTGTVSGFVNGDNQTSATTGSLSFNTTATPVSDVGSYAINGLGLTANNGNYAFRQSGGNATALTIDPAVLAYTANSATRTYGSANPVLTGTVTGFVNGDTQASATTGSLSFDTTATPVSNVGSYAIDGSGLTTSSNYTLQQAASNATALTISPATLTASVLAKNKVYDSTMDANAELSALSGLLKGDTVSVNTVHTVYAFNDKNVGKDKQVTASDATLDGPSASNYTLDIRSGTADITPAIVTAAVVASDKVYDATPNAEGQVRSLDGVLGHDDLTIDATQTRFSFSDKNVGSGKIVSGSGLRLSGVDAANYQLNVKSGMASITPATLTAVVMPDNKTYDGTSATAGRLGALTGVFGADAVGLDTTGIWYSFQDAASGTAKPVNAAGAILSGIDAANYQLKLQNGIANISPVPATVSVGNVSRPFGAPNPVFTATYSGQLLPGIDMTALLASISFEAPGAAAGPGLYTIFGRSTYPNVDLTILPGTLTVIAANTPQSNPALVPVRPTVTPPPLSVPAMSTVLAPNSLGLLHVNYSIDWSMLADAIDGSFVPFASSSFVNLGTPTGNTYPGGIRKW
jgi:filamentous hemagglutinin family protein